jgi:hypothetical protein
MEEGGFLLLGCAMSVNCFLEVSHTWGLDIARARLPLAFETGVGNKDEVNDGAGGGERRGYSAVGDRLGFQLLDTSPSEWSNNTGSDWDLCLVCMGERFTDPVTPSLR